MWAAIFIAWATFCLGFVAGLYWGTRKRDEE
jgi:hypothetical protein